jgi:hypothetical protein
MGHKQTSRLISDESVYPSISDIGRRWSHGSAIIACRADWKYEFKTGAMSICLYQTQFTAVLLCDSPTDRKAKSHTARFCRKKRIEYPVAVLGRYSVPGVLDIN